MIPSVFPHRAGSPALRSSSWSPLDPLLVFFELQNQNWTMCRLPSAEQSGKDHVSISASSAPAETAQDLICLHGCSDISHSASCPPAPTGPFHQGCSSATQIQACTGLVGYVVPGPGPCTLLSFIQFLLLPACPGLSVRWHPF